LPDYYHVIGLPYRVIATAWLQVATKFGLLYA